MAGGNDHQQEELDDHEERIRKMEGEYVKLLLGQGSHEEICKLRYEAIQKDTQALRNNMRMMLYVVVAAALVQIGVASVGDLVRSGAGRFGITITQPAPQGSTP